MAIEMYRMRLGNRRNMASWGEVKYFESRDTLERELFNAVISAEQKKARTFLTRQMLSYWAKRIFGDDRSETIDSIYFVEQMIDGEWVPMKYEFTPPKLTLEPETADV